MSFKTYRPKGTIQAQEVVANMQIGDQQVQKGDYMTLVDGKAEFMSKADFESKYEPVRQKKSAEGGSSKKKAEKKATTQASSKA